MSKYLVGTDSGTQSSRVIIFDTEGNIVAKGSAKHPDLILERQGWSEHGEEDCWKGFCEAAKDALNKFKGNPKDIIGIGFSSQRGVTYCLDKDGNQLQRPISWMDQRMAYGIEKMDREIPPFWQFLRYYSKANWTKVNRPEIFDKTDKWLTNGGYLGYKLTGEFVDTIANQNGGFPVDKTKFALHDEDWAYECVGTRRDQLPKMFLPGEVMGYVSAQSAAESGLPQGCPVIACAGDKQGEVLGAGCIENGQCYITFGTCTSLDIVAPVDRPSPDLSYLVYMACRPHQYNYEASLSKGYWLISWLRDNMGMDLATEAKARGVSIEELLNWEAADVPAGSEGLIIIPDWWVPRCRPNGKGMIFGFDDRHKRKHIFRAMIEGISQQLKINTDIMCSQIDGKVTEIRAGGGGSLSPITMQSTADIFGVPVRRTHTSETCALGAAISAAVGSGVYSTYEDAVAHMVSEGEVFHPIPENVKLYRELREKVHMKAYSAMKPIFDDLVELTGQK